MDRSILTRAQTAHNAMSSLHIKSLFVGLSLVALSATTWAQNTLDNPDWVELPMPPIPSFSKDKLITIDMPAYVSLKIGVDPASIQVGSDGIVRYVVVMQNTTGAVNAAYEALRCVNNEVKTYARLTSSGQWSVLESPVWRHVTDNMPSRHAQAISRQGACSSRLALSQEETIKALKAGASKR